jgi:hypothetical protein
LTHGAIRDHSCGSDFLFCVSDLVEPLGDTFLQAAIGGEVIPAASERGRQAFHVGDRITLVGDIFPVTLEFTLRGIYDNLTDDGALLFDYEYLREALKARRGGQLDQVSMYLLIADSAESVPKVSEAVDRMFENSPAETKTESERVGLVHELRQLAGAEELLDRGHHGTDVDQRLRSAYFHRAAGFRQHDGHVGPRASA